jgi:DNA polymerase III alpha subunit (gram-positive type)
MAAAMSFTLACAPRVAPPPHVLAVDAAPYAANTPRAAPDQWMLAHLDVETTGLVAGYHEMIDLGIAYTDLDGRVRDSLFLRIMPRHPERTSDGARRVNGFDADRWRARGALSPEAAVDSLRAFHQRVAAGRSVMLVAFNSHFDSAFLDHLFRARTGTWRELYHYFVLDIPSMAWALGMRHLTGAELSRALGVADEPRVADDHTGITGAMLNVRIYQALRARGMSPIP